MEHKNRIVVKVGTSTITHENGETDLRTLDALCRVLAGISGAGNEVILVSSGAIAIGAGKMRLKERPRAMREKQAAAAVGQCELMHLYDKLFAEYGKLVAQILLVESDVEDTAHCDNLKNTFDALLEQRVIPIVNENDSVSYREIESHEKLFSDNDMLSAIVAAFVNASKLIILTDIEGLYDKNPAEHADATLLSRVDSIDDTVRSLAKGSGSNRGTGGMVTKLDAAAFATARGIDVHITYGRKPENLYRILDGEPAGTLFPKKEGS